jgi:mRNA interferase MazF
MPITTSYNRGTVVLLPFPFSDQSAVKYRPAIVAHPPYPSEDLIVVAITSIGDALRPGEFPIQSWREAGLLHPSFAKRAIASITVSLVRRPLGEIRDDDLARLERALRHWLGL